MTAVGWLRIAVLLVLVGVATEFIAVASLTPGTFLTFVLLGVPCMLLGVLIYVVYVVRVLVKRNAL